jgi:hypothetical protein
MHIKKHQFKKRQKKKKEKDQVCMASLVGKGLRAWALTF